MLNQHCHRPIDCDIIHEKVLGADSLDLGHIDYSYKAVKSVLHDEAAMMELTQLNSVIPILYGSMPNSGLYTKPDGPVDNWSELLPLGKIDEARAAQEEAVEHAVKDIVYVAEGMYEAGADGVNIDTSGASGDADVLAALKAIEIIKEKFPDLGIEMGMEAKFRIALADEGLKLSLHSYSW